MKSILRLFSILTLSILLLSATVFADDFAWKHTLRGVTGNLSLTESDLRYLAEDWKVNSIRLMLMNGDVRQPGPPYAIRQEKLEDIDRFLKQCQTYHIRCILDVHETPGRVEWRGKKDRRLWSGFEFHQYLIDTWKTLAKRYADWGPVVAGYDLFNEPNMQKQVANEPSDWNLLAKKLIQAIREYDSVHPIVVEPVDWGNANGFEKLTPLNDPLIVYSFHFYTPHAFTHQTLDGDSEQFEYPGIVKGKMWDKDALEEAMQPAIEFQKKTGAPIYVGEFSAIRWAPGESSLHYLSDVVDLFEKYGWHWSYHAYREWQGWSLEHQGSREKPEKVKTTPRLEMMKQYWAKNRTND